MRKLASEATGQASDVTGQASDVTGQPVESLAGASDQGLDNVALWNAAMLQSTDVKAAMKSFMNKETPEFEPLRGSSQHAKL